MWEGVQRNSKKHGVWKATIAGEINYMAYQMDICKQNITTEEYSEYLQKDNQGKIPQRFANVPSESENAYNPHTCKLWE